MAEPSDTMDLAELPDVEGRLYLIGIDAQYSERMMETLGKRFDQLLDDADFLVVGGEMGAETDLLLSIVDENGVRDLDVDQIHKDRLKEAVEHGGD